MYVCTANLWNGMTSAQRREDAGIVFNGLPAPKKTLVCWQELRPEGSHEDVMSQEPAGSYHAFSTIPLGVTVPTERYTVLEETIHQTLEPSPDGDNARYFGVLRLQLEWRTWPTNRAFLINTHFPAGSNWNSTNPTAEELRNRERWNHHFNLMQDEIKRIKALDKTVFWAGDFNRQSSMPKFLDDEKIAIGHSSIDKIAVRDANVTTAEDGNAVIELKNSDHNAKWAKWLLA